MSENIQSPLIKRALSCCVRVFLAANVSFWSMWSVAKLNSKRAEPSSEHHASSASEASVNSEHLEMDDWRRDVNTYSLQHSLARAQVSAEELSKLSLSEILSFMGHLNTRQEEIEWWNHVLITLAKSDLNKAVALAQKAPRYASAESTIAITLLEQHGAAGLDQLMETRLNSAPIGSAIGTLPASEISSALHRLRDGRGIQDANVLKSFLNKIQYLNPEEIKAGEWFSPEIWKLTGERELTSLSRLLCLKFPDQGAHVREVLSALMDGNSYLVNKQLIKSELDLAFRKGESLSPFTAGAFQESTNSSEQFLKNYASGVTFARGPQAAIEWARSLDTSEDTQRALDQIFYEETSTEKRATELNEMLSKLDPETGVAYRSSLKEWIERMNKGDDGKRKELIKSLNP